MGKTKTPVRYIAKQRGYVDGKIIEEGEPFVTDAAKGSWMEPVDMAEYEAAVAATDPSPDDPNYDAMSLTALQALAATDDYRIDIAPGGKPLSKSALLAAIKAKRKPTA
ncbi:hypothetical protein [Sphingobium sp. TCM1]|uniref:hypothetical protein n=1 Tax=Sphingobium sp. TCM1 TaxID=453246 RepID=UPI0007F33163|nr:hypothetical protein [Sphingobium sp. TCM1]OAN56928.1 hypothetical protein A7Q26_17685 [Sphingobium sp. TCM1]